MRKKKDKSTHLRIALSVIITAIVVTSIIVAISFWYSPTDETVENILVIEEEYIRSSNAFSVEYEVAAPEQVTSIASLERAREGITKAKPLLVEMKNSATEIRDIIVDSKSDLEGDKLQWFEKAEGCYNKRLIMIDNYNQVLSNEEKYFKYYESILAYDLTYGEFSQLLLTYMAYGNSNDETNAKKTLEKMEAKIKIMQSQLEKANEAISLSSLGGLIEWTSTYGEVIDLGIEYHDSSGYKQTNLEKQILDKGVEAGKILNDATNNIGEDIDNWYIPNVSKLRDEADRNFLAANQECDEAAMLYDSLFT